MRYIVYFVFKLDQIYFKNKLKKRTLDSSLKKSMFTRPIDSRLLLESILKLSRMFAPKKWCCDENTCEQAMKRKRQ